MSDTLREIKRDEKYVYYEWRGKILIKTIEEVNKEREIFSGIPSKDKPLFPDSWRPE